MKEKHADVTNTLVCLQTVAEVLITAVTRLTNYCNDVSKRTYAGLQRAVITFYCRELQVLEKINLC
jgi:hypothetical protein